MIPPPPPPPPPPPTPPPPRAHETAWLLYLACCSALSVFGFLRHAWDISRRDRAVTVEAQ